MNNFIKYIKSVKTWSISFNSKIRNISTAGNFTKKKYKKNWYYFVCRYIPWVSAYGFVSAHVLEFKRINRFIRLNSTWTWAVCERSQIRRGSLKVNIYVLIFAGRHAIRLISFFILSLSSVSFRVLFWCDGNWTILLGHSICHIEYRSNLMTCSVRFKWGAL